MVQIKWNQPKYVFGVIGYVGLLLIGGLVIWLFDTDIKEAPDPKLKSTEYLNADLPEANVREDIGSKRRNVQETFGNISDYSSIENVESDLDSVLKKEDFTSQYTEEELNALQEQRSLKEENEKLKAQLAASARKGNELGEMSENDFQLPLTPEDRARLLNMRRNGELAEMEKDLNIAKGSRLTANDDELTHPEIVIDTVTHLQQSNAVIDDKDKEPSEVVKKINESNQYFNTLAENEEESRFIHAIVDEEIKVVEGSRVRLRLLDDIEIDGTQLKKGRYLYAIMSGFSQQRVQGTVKSIMVGDDIHKINLAIYDMDGMEGLYVPASSFRETTKDVASSAMNSNMSLNNTSGGNNVEQWAMQGVQNAYQRVSSSIAKAIKKNKVRIKYGTHIYLVNSKNKK